MVHRPRKGKHFSRYAMGFVFLACGLLLFTVHLLAGGLFLALAAVILYYAPRWNLRIEITSEVLRFSENVVETTPVDLALADIAEIRRVEEKYDRKGFLSMQPEYHPFVEFETRAGKIYRMHDIFGQEFDEEILRAGPPAGIRMDDFPRERPDSGDP
jgi:hypothetical protein